MLGASTTDHAPLEEDGRSLARYGGFSATDD